MDAVSTIVVDGRRVTEPRRGVRLARAAATGLGWASIVALAPGVLLQSALLISIATCCAGWALAARDVSRVREGAIVPITLFEASLGLTGFANAFGVVSITRQGAMSSYALYVREDYLFLASMLLLVGGMATIIGYRLIGQSRPWRFLCGALPQIHGVLPLRSLAIGGAMAAAFAMALHFTFGSIGGTIGTIGSLLLLAPSLVAFVLARVGMSRSSRLLVTEGLVIALVEATRAALFAYLRSEMLLPLFAFGVGALLGRRSLTVFRSGYFAPLYGAALLFATYFATFGEVRSTIGTGRTRIAALIVSEGSDAAEYRSESDSEPPALMVRLSSLNQLSQIGALADKGGFLGGKTLSYLAFAFVPRFLWPGKPNIAKGQWFAYQLGLASRRPDGSYTNSINMTVPGELYLNFAWSGVVGGCALFGAILAALWSTTRFWQDERNALGMTFGFYLLWVSFGLGADLQIFVTLIAAYIAFTSASWSLAGLRRSRFDRARPSAGRCLSETPAPWSRRIGAG